MQLQWRDFCIWMKKMGAYCCHCSPALTYRLARILGPLVDLTGLLFPLLLGIVQASSIPLLVQLDMLILRHGC